MLSSSSTTSICAMDCKGSYPLLDCSAKHSAPLYPGRVSCQPGVFGVLLGILLGLSLAGCAENREAVRLEAQASFVVPLT